MCATASFGQHNSATIRNFMMKPEWCFSDDMVARVWMLVIGWKHAMLINATLMIVTPNLPKQATRWQK
eukprot:4424174-Amphidinium_carterae.1